MYLKNRPWKFEKDGQVVFANYTAEARDLNELGYKLITEDSSTEELPPRIVEEEEEEEDTIELDALTRAELMELLDEAKVEYKSNSSKSEPIKLCEAIGDD